METCVVLPQVAKVAKREDVGDLRFLFTKASHILIVPELQGLCNLGMGYVWGGLEEVGPLGWRWSLANHLLTYRYVMEVEDVMMVLHFFSVYHLRLQMELSCWVDVGMTVGQYGIRWPRRWNGVRARGIGSLVEPCLASLSSFIMTKDVGMCSNFANVSVIVSLLNVVNDGGCEELVGMVILRGWMAYMVVK